MYKILSCDGGGLRGILTATVLERLLQARPSFLNDVDLFAGTSTGALISMGLAMGKTPTDIVNFYTQYGPSIFSHSFLHDALSLEGLHAAKYETDAKRTAFQAIFGSLRLGDLSRRVLVPTFKLDSAIGPQADTGTTPSWKAKFFHNFPGPDSDGDQSLLDVAMRTSAAPVYFPIYQGYVDGGMVANDPSVCALCQAIDPVRGAGKSLDQIVVLSLGTGASPDFISSLDGDWGLIQWNANLVEIPLAGSEGLADYQCRQLLGDRYSRLEPALQKSVGLDSVSAMKELRALGQSVSIDAIVAFLDRQWN